MIRAARFVAQLDVAPAERVLEGIHSMRDRLDIVAVERMQAEIDKLLVGDHPAKGLSLLVDTGLADVFLPELPALQLEQDPIQQHKDVLRHTYAVVERCEPGPGVTVTLRATAGRGYVFARWVGSPPCGEGTDDEPTCTIDTGDSRSIDVVATFSPQTATRARVRPRSRQA